MRHQIIVGNVGTVCDTDDGLEAQKDFSAYLNADNAGRADGETLTWMDGGEVKAERIVGEGQGLTLCKHCAFVVASGDPTPLDFHHDAEQAERLHEWLGRVHSATKIRTIADDDWTTRCDAGHC